MNKKQNKKDAENVVFAWEGPDFIKYQKGKLWYAIAFLVAVLFFTWALFEHSISMAISTVCMVIAYYLYDQKMPTQVQISISHFGVHVGKKLTPFSEIKSFYLDYNPPLRAVSFQIKGKMHHNISLLFPKDLDPAVLRQFLLTQVPEQKTEDRSFFDLLLKAFRL